MRPYLHIAQRHNEFPELDGLRGIAILLVLFRHSAHPVIEHRGEILRIGNWDIVTPLLNGWMGVDLFFVLSGFLVCHHLLKVWPNSFNFGFLLRYWSKRALRTFPAYFAAVAAAMAGIVPYFQPEIADIWYSLRLHALFLQDYAGSDLVPAFWSLAVEEKFYVICPILLLLLRKSNIGLQIALLMILVFTPLAARLLETMSSDFVSAGYPAFFWSVRSPFHMAMDGLWVGVICGLVSHLLNRGDEDFQFPSKVLCVSGSVLVLLVWLPFAWLDDVMVIPATVVLNIAALGFGMIVLSVVTGPTFLGTVLRSVILLRLSVLSYSLYLVHMMFVPLAMHLVIGVPGLSNASAIVQLCAMFSVLCCFSVPAAILLHLGVEKPFLKLKSKISLSGQSGPLPEPSQLEVQLQKS